MKKENSIGLKQIGQGYSKGEVGGDDIYFKHLTFLDHTPVEEFYDETFEWAKKRGLPTEEEQLAFLIDEGIWTESKESQIKQLTSSIEYNKQALPQAFIGQQKKDLKKKIEETETKLLSLRIEKDEVMGETSEKVANRRASEFLIYRCSFSSKKLTKRFFGKTQFQELEASHVQEVVRLYNSLDKMHNTPRIKHICIEPYFVSMFSLCKSSKDFFDATSVIGLTYPQVELLSYAKSFSNIILNNKIPDNVKEDPDGIMDWYLTKNTNSEKIEKMKGKNGASIVAGSNKEELDSMGMGDGLDLRKLIRSGASKADIVKSMS